MGLPERIKERREKAGLSQEALAGLVDGSRNAVINWETGKQSPISKTLIALASALNTSVAYLVDETDDPAPSIKKSASAESHVTLHIDETEKIRIEIFSKNKNQAKILLDALSRSIMQEIEASGKNIS